MQTDGYASLGSSTHACRSVIRIGDSNAPRAHPLQNELRRSGMTSMRLPLTRH